MNPDAPDSPETPPTPVLTGGILPGMAAISIFLLLVTMLNAFAALRGIFGAGPAKYGIFGVCSLLVVGIFGFLRLRRWGWALVTAGCLVMALGDFYLYGHNHVAFFIVRGLLELCFFLYLVRPQVRERLR
jgi:hypothetical protein